MATSDKEKGSFEEKEVSEKEVDEGEKEASDKGDSPASTQSDTKRKSDMAGGRNVKLREVKSWTDGQWNKKKISHD